MQFHLLMLIYINKTLSGSLREPKNKGKVQLGYGPKVVAVASGHLQGLAFQTGLHNGGCN